MSDCSDLLVFLYLQILHISENIVFIKYLMGFPKNS